MANSYTTCAGTLPIPMLCEFCRHSYSFNRDFKGSAPGTGPVADQEARADMLAAAKVFADNNDTYGVLCPSCKRFSTKAMKRHFPKGFREAILAHHRYDKNFQRIVGLILGIGFGLVAVGLAVAVVWIRIHGQSEPGELLSVSLVFLLTAGLSAFSWLGMFLPGMRGPPQSAKVGKQLKALSDADVFAIIEERYRISDSLESLFNVADKMMTSSSDTIEEMVARKYNHGDRDESAKIRIQCLKCQTRLRLSSSASSRFIKCPSCGARLKV